MRTASCPRWWVVLALAILLAVVPIDAPAQTSVKNQQITMSDGVILIADIDIPHGAGPFPVILMYTPYGPTSYSRDYLSSGYVHVNVDARGRGRSGGANCVVCEREQQDVYELIDWASKQPWSTGNVGMIGGSYMSFIQLLVAAKKPPALKAIVPRVSWSDLYRDAAYQNGLFNYIGGVGVTVFPLGVAPVPPDPASVARSTERRNSTLPLVLVRQHPFDGPVYYERAVYTKYESIEVPALFIGGWFDIFAAGMLRNFTGVASEHKRLIMGPWAHGRAGNLGPPNPFEPYQDVVLPSPDPVLAWYDRFLKGIDNGVEGGPEVLFYDTGTEEWISGSSWPPAGSGLVDLHLSGAPSDSILSLHDGSLFDQMPSDPAGSDSVRYVYDPSTGLGQATSPSSSTFLTPFRRLDQRVDEARGVTYTTPVVASPLALYGPMELELWAATTAPDTDWVVKVSDVAPDGTSLLISTGFVRASQRAVDESRSRPGEPWLRNTHADPVPNGVAVPYRIPIDPVGVTLGVGHRLRVAIYSADIAVHEPLPYPAVNTIYHDAAHPSVLRLTVATP